jgi:hypothetical protein
VKVTVVDLKHVEASSISVGELVQEPLIAPSINMGELQKERFSRSRFDSIEATLAIARRR